jgi:hypothetical protein
MLYVMLVLLVGGEMEMGLGDKIYIPSSRKIDSDI